ncbi:hypothetical protein GobsT_02850 [Gemmata obscuriglobus]|nr:hypothetical protein [Gemmata obscuriglobus]QEG25558.1 hypothetical protein GobsT_02850 [Gemmata obscuriglobus]VTR98944.1 unnamed protein product [Gemmata obscuriglobus UQM 2246]
MFRLLLSGFVLTVAALVAGADEKKDPKATTTWVRESNGVDLKFEFGKDAGTFNVFVGENGVVVKAKLTREKDTVTAEFTEVEEKGNFPSKPKKGDKISFTWVEKDGAAKLSDLKGADDAKDVLEGEYKVKK